MVYLFNTSGQLLRTFQNPSPASDDFFGNSVALVGNDVLVGAIGVNGGRGAAYLFDTSGQLLEMFSDPSAKPEDNFATSVALTASDALIGAIGPGGSQGAAYMYSTSGQLLQRFVDPSAGGQYFGSSVALVGNEVIVGAQGDYDFQGATCLFNVSGQVIQTFLDPNAAVGDNFGHAVAGLADQSRTNIVVGAFGVNMDQGAAYLYQDPVILKTVPDTLLATIGTTFSSRLGVLVRDATGNPLAGVPVTFSVSNGRESAGRAGGAGADFPDRSSTIIVLTNADGEATAPALRANDASGRYLAAATIGNESTTFALTNIAGAPAAIRVYGGGSQHTSVGRSFPAALEIQVLDRFKNPVANQSVRFTIVKASTGAGGTFPGGAIIVIETTNAEGVAAAPTLTANSSAGTFTATASVAGLRTPPTFSLTNDPSRRRGHHASGRG
jgi:hypothetical protein